MGRLKALQDAIEEVMTPLGYPPEKRGFTPHLTLGRIGRRASRSDAAQVGEVVAATTVESMAEVTADRFALIRSVLKPTGAEYTELEGFSLRGG
jgi:2'-5' RNA ligase